MDRFKETLHSNGLVAKLSNDDAMALADAIWKDVLAAAIEEGGHEVKGKVRKTTFL